LAKSSGEIATDRVQKLAMAASTRLLNSLINNPTLLDTSGLDEDIFPIKSAKAIFNSLVQLRRDGHEKFTPEMVLEEASSRQYGVTPILVERAFEFSDSKVESVADSMRHLRNATKSLSSVQRLREAEEMLETGDLDDESLRKARDVIEEATGELTLTDDYDSKRTYTGVEWLDEWGKRTTERRNGKQYPYGNQTLDFLINEGATPGDGLILTSSSGMGKSALCLNLVHDFLVADVPCIFFSSEMSLTTTMDRLIALHCQIPFKEIVNPPDADTFDAIRTESAKFRKFLDDKNLFRFSEDPRPSIADLEKAIRKFQVDAGRRYCIVFIDLLSMVKEFAKGRDGVNFAQQCELAMNQLNATAKDLGIHYIGTVQQSRDVEKDKIAGDADLAKTKPTRASIKNSNAYLERARTTIGLWREKAFAKVAGLPGWEDKNDVVTLCMLKSNNNEIQEGYMIFEPECFTMTPTTENCMSTEEERDGE
jgi:replicative DNA helicase